VRPVKPHPSDRVEKARLGAGLAGVATLAALLLHQRGAAIGLVIVQVLVLSAVVLRRRMRARA
jgi:hypothetical protein